MRCIPAAICLLAGTLAVPAVATAQVGPTAKTFTLDADDGAYIDPSTWDAYDDGGRADARWQGSGKRWELWPDTAYMGANSYKVRVTQSPWFDGDPDDAPNDRSEQKVLTQWSFDDGPRYFSLAVYVPSFTTIPDGTWLMMAQWWQDPSRPPALSLSLTPDGDAVIARRSDMPEPGHPDKGHYNNCGWWNEVWTDTDFAPDTWHRYMFKVDPGIGDGEVIVWKMNAATGQWVEHFRDSGLNVGFLFKRQDSCDTWPTTTPAPDTYANRDDVSWKLGTYRDYMPHTTTRIYFDNIRYTGNRWNWITGGRTIGYHRNVLALEFDETSGAIANDSSGDHNAGWDFDNDGTVVGATRIPASWGQCVRGGCLYFDGVDDHVDVPMDTVDFDTGNYLTLGAWFRGFAPQVGKSLITIDRYSTDYKTRLYMISDDRVSFTVRHPDGTLSTVTATVPRPLNDATWHHLAGTYNRFAPEGYRLAIYLDGERLATAAGVDKPIARGTHSVFVGKFSGNYFKGLIDDVTVFNYAMLPAQIADLAAP